jgi:hypothetical protein
MFSSGRYSEVKVARFGCTGKLSRSAANYHQGRINDEDCRLLRAILGSYDHNIFAMSTIEAATERFTVRLLNLKQQICKDDRNDLFRPSG